MEHFQQLPLSLKLPQPSTFDNFYPGSNTIVVDALRSLVMGAGENVVYLWGREGVGKTHLVQAACHYADANYISVWHLSCKNKDIYKPIILEGLENIPLLCIDDLQEIAKDREWEEQFFHLYNRVLAKNGRMLISATALPEEVGIQLGDLRSRLKAGLVFHLQPLNDAEKFQVLNQQAKMRGLELSEEVGEFLIRRCPRDMSSLMQILDQLDQLSLVNQRRLTIPFVKESLGI